MLNTNYGSNAEYYFNTTNHYLLKVWWFMERNYEKFIGLIEFSRNLRESLDKIESNLDHPPASMFERGTNVDERNIMFFYKKTSRKRF